MPKKSALTATDKALDKISSNSGESNVYFSQPAQ